MSTNNSNITDKKAVTEATTLPVLPYQLTFWSHDTSSQTSTAGGTGTGTTTALVYTTSDRNASIVNDMIYEAFLTSNFYQNAGTAGGSSTFEMGLRFYHVTHGTFDFFSNVIMTSHVDNTLNNVNPSVVFKINTSSMPSDTYRVTPIIRRTSATHTNQDVIFAPGAAGTNIFKTQVCLFGGF